MTAKVSKTFIYFLAVLFIVNLIQSHFTELIFDEAYYWYYAQDLAWGYFDHPPMVAFLITLSGFFFDGELGVRLMSCILSAGTFLVLWLLVDDARKEKHIPLFFIFGFSITLLNAYGFLTLPDTPLLFFTALFLWVYKQFIHRQSIAMALLLGFVMAALMYSKYHAVLVILFILLSNIRLVLSKYAWLAVFFALLCYTPHFVWLYENDLISIRYHLFERPNQAYNFSKFTLGYFLNLIALFGLTFPWVYWSLYKTKITNQFTKALVYLTYGVLLFFFISSFNRRVQTQWIIIIAIPLLVLTYNYMLHNGVVRKWIYRLAIVNGILLLYCRFWLVYQPLLPFIYESHGNKAWVKEITYQAEDVPVIFENSYRYAPMFAFYSGNTSFSLNNIMYRQNQYSIDSSEYRVQGKRVLYISRYMDGGDIAFQNAKGHQYYGVYKDDFESFRKLRCFVEGEPIDLSRKEKLTLKVYNPYSKNIDLGKIKFNVAYLNDYKQVKEQAPLSPSLVRKEFPFLKSKDTTYFTFTLPRPKIDAGYFKISIAENGLYTGLNGTTTKLK